MCRPINLPTPDHFAVVLRAFQEGEPNRCFARSPFVTTAESSGDLREPATTKETKGSVPQTQLFGATAAVLRYIAVSLLMAAFAVRWRKIVCLGDSKKRSLAEVRLSEDRLSESPSLAFAILADDDFGRLGSFLQFERSTRLVVGTSD